MEVKGLRAEQGHLRTTRRGSFQSETPLMGCLQERPFGTSVRVARLAGMAGISLMVTNLYESGLVRALGA